ncbi:MAG: hypothetical protein HC772_03915 [Leptolyngbyaceae cyanobacterium CRU_2_3]|nr:hypothetical protein [Leptolyngbyaceae cyanobacterium CRU_2_3]
MIKDIGRLKLSSHLKNYSSTDLSNLSSTSRGLASNGLTKPPSQRRASADLAGNTKKTALILPTTSAQTFRDGVSRNDSDFYSFTIDTSSNVQVSFLNQSKVNSIVKTVLNGNGSVFVSASQKQIENVQPRQDAIALYRRLTPGTYYVRLKSRSASESKYKLSVSITPAPPVVDCGCGG